MIETQAVPGQIRIGSPPVEGARYRWPGEMSRYESLRASDADRDAVVDRLREAASEGRLDPEELEERVEAALRARTYGQLGGLLGDLPQNDIAPQRHPRRRGAPLARSALVGAGLLAGATLAIAVVVLVVVLVLAAAAAWLAVMLLCAVCCGSRRRRLAGSARHSVRPRQRPRAASLL